MKSTCQIPFVVVPIEMSHSDILIISTNSLKCQCDCTANYYYMHTLPSQVHHFASSRTNSSTLNEATRTRAISHSCDNSATHVVSCSIRPSSVVVWLRFWLTCHHSCHRRFATRRINVNAHVFIVMHFPRSCQTVSFTFRRCDIQPRARCAAAVGTYLRRNRNGATVPQHWRHGRQECNHSWTVAGLW